MNEILLVALVLGAILVVVLLTRRSERNRAEALSRQARVLGLDYEKKSAELVTSEFAVLPLFDKGHAKKATNVMRGKSALPYLFLDYSYITGGGQTSRRHRQSVVAFDLGERDFPDFELRPGRLHHKIASVFGWQSIDFDNRPDFSRKYLLRGADEKTVRGFFNSYRLQFFEKNTAWAVECGDRWMLVYRERRRCKPEELPEFLESTRNVVDVFLR
jgi:hypothetical protein